MQAEVTGQVSLATIMSRNAQENKAKKNSLKISSTGCRSPQGQYEKRVDWLE